MQYRRFGRTEFQIPVISSGGMRFQHSWKSDDPVPDTSQENVNACVRHAFELGINHFETARGYGTSEYELGKILPQLPRDEILVQTKVGPMEDVEKFKATFEKSMGLLQLDYVDIFSFHGLNNEELLDHTMKCMDAALEWRAQGRIRDIGFSTHGETDSIVKAIETDAFDHVNVHWYYVFQDNWPAIEAATRHDMGVFIISPNEKAGNLHKPSRKLMKLCEPLHPMVFNGLFCLMHDEVHTLSCGASKPEDYDIHLQTVELLDDAREHVEPILERLESEMTKVLGAEWTQKWQTGLPDWRSAPGAINVPWVLRLRNLALAYDMIDYGRMRYNMLGNGGHWFPGNKAESAAELEWGDSLKDSPYAEEIPKLLADAHELLDGQERKRLQRD